MTTTNPDPTHALAGGTPASAPVVLSTGTRGTRILGIATIVSMAWLVAFGLGFSPADRDQREAVRLLYMHVPTIWVAYMAFAVTAIASAMVLYGGRGGRPKPLGWDRLAGASAEAGTAFVAVTLVVGALWGRLTWGVFWQWDARLTTTALLFVTYIGYLAVRRLGGTHAAARHAQRRDRTDRGARDPARALERRSCGAASTRRPRCSGSTPTPTIDGLMALQPLRRRHRVHVVLRLADAAPHPGDGDGGCPRRPRTRRRVGGPPPGRDRLMEDAGFIIGSYVAVFAVVGLLTGWVLRSGRRLAKRTPDADKYWT